MSNSKIDTQVSLSQVLSFRRCHQQYFYRYVARLKPRIRASAPELGNILHDYIATYCRWLGADMLPDDAHTTALMKVSADYVPTLKKYADSAEAVGQYETAAILMELPNVASRLANNYYQTRGKFDAERYEIILVEEAINVDITSRIRSTGYVDLVTRDNDSGLIDLWEHKSTTSVPDMSYRMRDLQTLLYAEKLAVTNDIQVDGIIWNYIRTKEPSVPAPLASGKGFSQDKSIDTTWEVYAAAVTKGGFNLADYEKMRELLEGRELTTFFPRFTQALIADPDVLLRDYTTTAKDIRRHKRAWADGTVIPVRNLQRDCSWFCEFRELCNAAVIGGDDSDLIAMHFTKG